MEPHDTGAGLHAREKIAPKIDPVFDPANMTSAERVAAAKALLAAARRSESTAAASGTPANWPGKSALEAEVSSLRETVDAQQRKLDALLESLSALGANPASEETAPEVPQRRPRWLHAVPDSRAG